MVEKLTAMQDKYFREMPQKPKVVPEMAEKLAATQDRMSRDAGKVDSHAG